MRSRQGIADIFSTYIDFDSDRFSGWLQNPRLNRSIKGCVAEVSDSQSSNFWAMYWYQHWHQQTHRLALGHLVAHLQEAGYWAAYKFVSRFDLRQFSLTDCFQIAFTRLEKGLGSFQPDRGTTLESFAKLFFTSTVRNELRRTHELESCSDWLLLRKTTTKKFIEALQTDGLSSNAIEQYRLAWMCFKHSYAQLQAQGTQQLPPPSHSTWQDIADLYNSERLGQLTISEKVTANQVEQWLTNCARRIRAYLTPSIASLNAVLPGNETFELQDQLPADSLAPMDYLVKCQDDNSRQAQQARLRQFLENSLADLEASERSLLQLYYRDHLTQQKIAKALDIKQYAVSRKLAQVRKKLLAQVIDWCQAADQKPCTSDGIEAAAEMLELWLQTYFDLSTVATA